MFQSKPRGQASHLIPIPNSWIRSREHFLYPKLEKNIEMQASCMLRYFLSGFQEDTGLGGGKGGKALLVPQNNFWQDMFFLHNWR
jgi:hypothetical protein